MNKSVIKFICGSRRAASSLLALSLLLLCLASCDAKKPAGDPGDTTRVPNSSTDGSITNLYSSVPFTEVHNVRDYGALGDSKADDTEAFRKAIADAKADGLPVYMPAGHYYIYQTLQLDGVTLIGYQTGAWTNDTNDLPMLVQWNEDEPLLQVNSSRISGISIVCKKNTMTAIEISGNNNDLSNMRIDSAAIAIRTADGSDISGSSFRNMFIIAAQKRALQISGVTGNLTLSSIESWYPDTASSTEIGFEFADIGNLTASDLFVFNSNTAYSFHSDGAGTRGSFLGCSCDYTSNGVRVEKGSHQLTFTGGTWWTHWYGLQIDESTSASTEVSFSGAEFRTNGGNCAKIKGGGKTLLSGNTMLRPQSGRSSPAIYVGGGANITISGNTISSNNDNVVSLMKAKKNTTITFTGNVLCGTGEASKLLKDNTQKSGVTLVSEENTLLPNSVFKDGTPYTEGAS